MNRIDTIDFIKNVIKNKPEDWTGLTTHRLDIYQEQLAKVQFLDRLQILFESNDSSTAALKILPTAYDYIRLGHPLSCLLEWGIAKLQYIKAEQVISFSSQTMPIFSILRTNKLQNKNTQINYVESLPNVIDINTLKEVYGYQFELKKVKTVADISVFDGSIIFIDQKDAICNIQLQPQIDFYIGLQEDLGSILISNGSHNDHYIPYIQHVRRRETIAMTPADCLTALQILTNTTNETVKTTDIKTNKSRVLSTIKEITGASLTPIVGSSGLSIQYAIMMGLIHEAQQLHKKKPIKFIVPPNCYGGTNDQARRIARSIDNVSIVDLPVDGDNDMVQSIERVLNQISLEDAIPYIIVEIPTNPRVEVPDLIKLKNVLSKKRKTANDNIAIDPVIILDQTFCPNYLFLGEGKILSSIKTISYVSGSKFPSGGQCTAGYCVGNNNTQSLMHKIQQHLTLCDNEATALQYDILARQLPSMNQRIIDAYKNTREFVEFIKQELPDAKINFVSEDLANQGFTPSVFSLDLPTKGNTPQEKETYKRDLNLKLIHLMIKEIPEESKFCVSYGQLKGCYWTVPATSTQGTTKEGDKDYIVRASLSPDLDLERHKKIFKKFVASI
jgi:cystathionine beta-lyase/cystathionine gamma-synthase